MKRRSSRGNPWHDRLGRFCHGPYAEIDTNGNPITDEQRKEATTSSEKDKQEYHERSVRRAGIRYDKERGGQVEESTLKHKYGIKQNDERRKELLKDYPNHEEMAMSISGYVNEGKFDELLLNQYIDNSPAYDGVIYRGMHFREEEKKYEEFAKLSPGDKIKMNGNSSWTSDENIANAFGFIDADEEEGVRSVLIVCEDNKTGASIKHLSEYGESEVLAHSLAQWEVVDVVRFRNEPEGIKVIVKEIAA